MFFSDRFASCTFQLLSSSMLIMFMLHWLAVEHVQCSWWKFLLSTAECENELTDLSATALDEDNRSTGGES